MKETSVYTSTINKLLMKKLNRYSDKFKVPKNKIIENALNEYFEKIKRAEFIRSFKRAKDDEDVILLSEQGLEDFLNILNRNK